MRVLKRQFACVVAIGITGGGISSAFAQGEPTPTKEPAPSTAPATESEEMCDPPNSCAQQPAPAPQPTTQPMTESPPPPPQHYYSESVEQPWVDRVGLGFAVGGGLDDFAGTTMRDTTSLGGSWTARVTLGTKSYVAFEGSYIGSAQNIEALGLGNNAVLVGNGAQGALRINLTTSFPVQPFVYAGAAWRHYSITNNTINTSDISNTDDVAEFPGGVGFSGYVGGFMADVRGEYRIATAEDLAPSRSGTGEASLDRWGVTGNLGFSY